MPGLALSIVKSCGTLKITFQKVLLFKISVPPVTSIKQDEDDEDRFFIQDVFFFQER